MNIRRKIGLQQPYKFRLPSSVLEMYFYEIGCNCVTQYMPIFNKYHREEKQIYTPFLTWYVQLPHLASPRLVSFFCNNFTLILHNINKACITINTIPLVEIRFACVIDHYHIWERNIFRLLSNEISFITMVKMWK